MAKVGRSTVGWFFGFKLHLIINDKGEILSFYLSQGNTSDNNAKFITRMTKELFGKMFGDKLAWNIRHLQTLTYMLT